MGFSDEERERYSRHLILENFGEEAQQKLKAARVLVIGAGGLGCPALLYLTAAGVGCIGIVDDDAVSLSNLQRQVLYTIEDLGQNKAVAAKKRLSSLNPHVHFNTTQLRITAENALDLIKDYDVVIDGTDNFSTRYLLNDACVILKKPLVYGAIFKFEGQVSVFNLDDGPTYRCLFPQPPVGDQTLSCNEVGVLGVLPGIIGTWQATEAIKIITGIGTPLKGRLLTIDLLTNNVSNFGFKAVPQNKGISQLQSYEEVCSPNIAEIEFAQLQQWLAKDEVQLIDVREQNEYDVFNIGGQLLPLSTLADQLHQIDATKLTVVHCQSGIRSKKAIAIIQQHLPAIRIYNLKDGLKAVSAS